MMRVQAVRTAARYAAAVVFSTAVVVFGQDATGSPGAGHGWPRADEPAAQASTQPAQAETTAENPPAEEASPYTMPARLTLQPGTFITVRVNQTLSSDRNQPGDAFSATLVQPLVIDGIVVAQRGQIAGGRVVEARKAGRVQGVSRLALELTDLTFVDGQQARIQSQLVGSAGPTSVGRDAAAIGTATGMGALIGAAADWGAGAAIGAGIGAAAGAVGVLATRGHPTIIYPESVLTFRLAAAVSVSTERAPQAFRYVDPTDYQQGENAQLQSRPRRECEDHRYRCGPWWPYYPGYYYWGPGWGPYYWGPSFSFFYAPRYYRPWFGGRVIHYRRGYHR